MALLGLYDDLCEINIDSRNEFDILKNDRHTKTKKWTKFFFYKNERKIK